MWKFCGKTVSSECRANCPKLCGNCAFPQNFHTRKSSEIMEFYAVEEVLCQKKVVSAPWKKYNFLGLSLVQRPSIKLLIPTWGKRNKTHIHFDYFDFEDITSPLQPLPICNLFVNIESCFHLLVNNQTLANC